MDNVVEISDNDKDIREIGYLDIHRSYPMDTEDQSKLLRIIYSLAKRIIILEAEKERQNAEETRSRPQD